MTRSHDFVSDVMPNDFFDIVIEWIGNYLDPDDVFDRDDLCDWAHKNASPDDIFDEDVLGDWATDNGYRYEV